MCLQERNIYISPKGTFIVPLVEDEQNNWANRGSLLSAYRELIGYIKTNKIDMKTSFLER
jgi:hypothetical protein